MCHCVYALEFNHVLNNCHATIGCLRPEFPSRGARARSLALPLSVRTCDEQGGPLGLPLSRPPAAYLPVCVCVCPSAACQLLLHLIAMTRAPRKYPHLGKVWVSADSYLNQL